MKCNICNHTSKELFSGSILNRYNCLYYRCTHCGFIQTEKPYWLDEAYNNAITDLDIGMLARNISCSNLLERLLLQYFDCSKPCLDYAGGYGMLTRMMRDKGFNYFRQDKYCNNLFSEYFDISDNSINHFEVLSAFEVFEHLVKPIEELKLMLKYTDNIIFSTELVPNKEIKTTNDWWYFAPQTGQHISFYTLTSLQVMASQINCHLYSNNINIHLITRKKLKGNPFHISPLSIKWKIIPFINKAYTQFYYRKKGIQLNSKTQEDYTFIKSKLDESTI